jgi:hypothetical protein
MLLVLASAPAHAMDWSIGSNLALSFLHETGGGVTTYLALPGAVAGLQPGLRIGFAGPNAQNELYADAGLLLTSVSKASNSALGLTGNYQFNFTPHSSTGFYANAGLGFLYNHVEAGPTTITGTSATFGGGFGVRKLLPSGYGAVRGELRYDWQTRSEDQGVTVIPEGSLFGIKVGFDLWLGESSSTTGATRTY